MRSIVLALPLFVLSAIGRAAGSDSETHPMQRWQHHAVIEVVERAGVPARRFPVSVRLNAEGLAEEGKMQRSGADVRVTIGGKEVPVQTEDLPDGQMLLTFQVDLEPGQVRDDLALHYGNPDAAPPQYDTTWGRISPANDGFENERLRVSYGLKTGTFGQVWGCQNTFVIKACEEDQFGGEAIPESWAKARNDVTYWEPDTDVAPTFEVEADGPVYKRVRFFAPEKMIEGRHRVSDLSQRVTFYRDCPFIEEEYENIRGAVVDTAVPGGIRKRTDGARNFDFVAYKLDPGEITWEGRGDDKETRGGFTADKGRAQSDPRYDYMGEHSYNDRLILGVVNVHNGRGIGTCAAPVQTAFFVDWHAERAGYSLWPDGTGRMTRCLYYVEDGPREVIARGKLLAAPPAATLIDDRGPRQDWGRVVLRQDSDGQYGVVLENEQISVHYETRMTGESLQTYIRRLTIAGFDENQGHWLDAAAWRTFLKSATIVWDGPEAKTVRLEWAGRGNWAEATAVSKVSIYPDSPVLKIDYLSAAFPHVCDIGTPGGSRENGAFAIHGAEEWQEARRRITAPALREHPNEHHRLTDYLYPAYPFPLVDGGWGQEALDRNGWYVMGVFNPANGQGFGRVVPVDAVPYIKLLGPPTIRGYGFELFPSWRTEFHPYTSYLFAVTGGADEILSVGRDIADRARPVPPDYEPDGSSTP